MIVKGRLFGGASGQERGKEEGNGVNMIKIALYV
jgi:hypothetical protein